MAEPQELRTPDRHKSGQIGYYDHGLEDPEFEINRPHGESRLYQYAMDFKFERVIETLGHGLRGQRVLSICCGSGMDAEYLARAGALVVALDLSMGCLRRARTRSARYDVEYELVQADAERLPFNDRSFDYSFVHDGLHHLTNHEAALAEMARVARKGVLISEPARAAITSIPTALGLMSETESAGNKVNRLDPRALAEALTRLGFHRVKGRRYLMKYGHPPPRWWRYLDGRPQQDIARLGLVGIGATVLAPWGNKLVMVAERSHELRH